MSGPITPHEHLAQSLAKQGGPFLSALLIVLAVLIFCVALLPDHVIFKAVVAAWVIIP